MCKHEATKVCIKQQRLLILVVCTKHCVCSLGRSSSSSIFCLCGHANIEKPFGRNVCVGLSTKVRACEGVGQERAQESHFMLPGVQKNVRE